MKPILTAAIALACISFAYPPIASPASATAQSEVDVLAIRCEFRLSYHDRVGPRPTAEKAIKIDLIDFSGKHLAPIVISEPKWHSDATSFQFIAPEGGFFATLTDTERGCTSRIRLVTSAGHARHLRIAFGHGLYDWHADGSFAVDAPANLSISVLLMDAPVTCGTNDLLWDFWHKKRGEYQSVYDDGFYYGWLGGVGTDEEALLSISVSSLEGRVLIKSAAFQKGSRGPALQHVTFTLRDYENWLKRSDEGDKVLCI